jgi:hypothetical protein
VTTYASVRGSQAPLVAVRACRGLIRRGDRNTVVVIDPEELARHIAAHGACLYHATNADPEAIARAGLIPGSELGVHTSPSPFLHTRAGHVYLGGREYLKRVLATNPHWNIVWAVDLRQLDPERVVPDEDVVSAAWWGHGWEGFPITEHWVSVAAPLHDVGWQSGPNREGTRAHWAETTPGFDAPDVTAKSLAHGSVAYRGRIPPHALRRDQDSDQAHQP